MVSDDIERTDYFRKETKPMALSERSIVSQSAYPNIPEDSYKLESIIPSETDDKSSKN